MPAGRPLTYSQEVADLVCDRIIEGCGMRQICADENLPEARTVYRWLERFPEFCQQYERAKEFAMFSMADDILEIADDTSQDTHTTTYGDGQERVSANTEWISRARLRVDSRKWLMSKLAPKKYGDKIVQQHQGHDGGALTVSWKKAE